MFDPRHYLAHSATMEVTDPGHSSSMAKQMVGKFSMHGVGNVVRSETRFRQVFWACVVVACFIALAVQISILTSNYLKYESVISLQVVHANEQPFPTVSICNQNRFRKSRLEEKLQKMFVDFLKSYDNKSTDDPPSLPLSITRDKRSADENEQEMDFEADVDGKNLTLPEPVLIEWVKEEPVLQMEYIPPVIHGIEMDDARLFYEPPRQILKSEVHNQFGFNQIFPEPNEYVDMKKVALRRELIHRFLDQWEQGTPLNDRQRYGHTLEDMLISCKWQFQDCGAQNFTRFHSVKYGNCFSFAPGETLMVNREEAVPGKGLRLEMFVDIDEYLPYVTDELGMRIVIHAKGEPAQPMSRGLNLSPGQATHLAVRASHTKRLPPPYDTRCIDRDHPDTVYMDAQVAFNPHVHYTTDGCLQTCYQRHVHESCGCVLHGFPNNSLPFGGNNSKTGLRACADDDAGSRECLRRAVIGWYDHDVACDCPDPCYQVTYTTHSLSQSRWPAPSFEAVLEDRIRTQLGRSVPGYRLERETLKCVVYLENVDHELMEHRPTTELSGLLGELGGSLGVCLGVSVVALVEVLELMWFFIHKVLCAVTIAHAPQARCRRNEKYITSSGV